MKLKSFFIFLLIVLMTVTILPIFIMCIQMGAESLPFEDTWMGKMISQM